MTSTDTLKMAAVSAGAATQLFGNPSERDFYSRLFSLVYVRPSFTLFMQHNSFLNGAR
jgi:hypothetical protein